MALGRAPEAAAPLAAPARSFAARREPALAETDAVLWRGSVPQARVRCGPRGEAAARLHPLVVRPRRPE